MSPQITARVTAGILGAIIIFQLALVLGAPWGAFTQGGGTQGTLPASGRIIAAVSIVILAVMALALLARAGEGPLARAPRRLITVLAWFATVYAGIAVVANLATPSASERLVWAPVSVVMFVLALTTMIRTRPMR